MRFIILISTILFSSYSFIFTQTIALKEVINPKGIVVKNNRLFVNDNAESVKIYDSKTFKFIKSFGRRGEGPGEFKVSGVAKDISIYIADEEIYVKSIGRVSLFDFNGKYLKDIKLPISIYGLLPLKNCFIFKKLSYNKNGSNDCLILADKDLKETLTLVERKSPIDFKSDMTPAIIKNISVSSCDNLIFISSSNDFNIKVVNTQTLKSNEFNYPYKNIPISDKLKELIISRFKKSGIREKNIAFPSSLPAINKISCDQNYLYVFTYKIVDDKRELMVFTHDCKFIKKVMIQIEDIQQDIYPFKMPVFTIDNGKFFQLIEGEDEVWYLKISSI